LWECNAGNSGTTNDRARINLSTAFNTWLRIVAAKDRIKSSNFIELEDLEYVVNLGSLVGLRLLEEKGKLY
jgi:hypothetical protein